MTYSSATQATYTWAWDPADRSTQQTIVSKLTTTITSTETSSYGYNFRNELTGATHNGFTPNEGYVYDGTGNRTGGTYAHPVNNEMAADNAGNTYSYDDEGNRTKKWNGGNVVGTYTWDHRNRLTSAQVKVGATTTLVEYTYDLMDRRIERRVNGAATNRWGYDGESIALEFDGANTLTHRYLHGPVIDQVFADERSVTSTGTYWTLTDHLGSVRDVVDNNGTSTKHIKYNSFGERQVSGTGPEVLYSWTGREYDVETELQYNRARWYDAKVGRWLSTDPIGFNAGDSNLYRYVMNQPTVLVDPTGLVQGVGVRLLPHLPLEIYNEIVEHIGHRAFHAVAIGVNLRNAIQLEASSTIKGNNTIEGSRSFPWAEESKVHKGTANGLAIGLGIEAATIDKKIAKVKTILEDRKFTPLALPLKATVLYTLTTGAGAKTNGDVAWQVSFFLDLSAKDPKGKLVAHKIPFAKFDGRFEDARLKGYTAR